MNSLIPDFTSISLLANLISTFLEFPEELELFPFEKYDIRVPKVMQQQPEYFGWAGFFGGSFQGLMEQTLEHSKYLNSCITNSA